MDNKKVVIVSGGTMERIDSHLALVAPAFGNIANQIKPIFESVFEDKFDVVDVRTKIAGGKTTFYRPELHCVGETKSVEFKELQHQEYPVIATNDDLNSYVDSLIEDPTVKIVFFPVAVCDFKVDEIYNKDETICPDKDIRLKSSEKYSFSIIPTNKIIKKIRQKRKDIFLVAFKQTSGKSPDEQYSEALKMCKSVSANLVLANDSVSKYNIIVTPEESRYPQPKGGTFNREEALYELVEMSKLRSHLTFTRSTVITGESIPWDSEMVPESLRLVVDYCIEQKAYKPVSGVTAGHFAYKVNDTTFLTSIRKTDFNQLKTNGLVKIETDGPDTVLAYGARPSVGGQSQRIVFNDHPGLDCIVHFHSPLKENPRDDIPVKSQREFSCGSHECGKNTSEGLKEFDNGIHCVYLENHGPNIVFNQKVNPSCIVDFIKSNFDIEHKTGGYVESLNE